MSEPAPFPMYLMKINGHRIFLNFRDAYVTYNSGSADVQFGRYVLNEDFTVIPMTDADKAKISKAADKYDEGK